VVFKEVPDESLDYLGVSYYLSFFVSDFTNLCLFHPHFSEIFHGLVNVVYIFKETAFCFIDSL
jgi:hypothetical protein